MYIILVVRVTIDVLIANIVKIFFTCILVKITFHVCAAARSQPRMQGFVHNVEDANANDDSLLKLIFLFLFFHLHLYLLILSLFFLFFFLFLLLFLFLFLLLLL